MGVELVFIIGLASFISFRAAVWVCLLVVSFHGYLRVVLYNSASDILTVQYIVDRETLLSSASSQLRLADARFSSWNSGRCHNASLGGMPEYFST
ncbi:hypothetical protein F5Y10DRAFT_229865 [Nemania abortiva]|nr:hypothetical protein F5Y10DRAFT_229865 [Nemania abortiva]